MAETIQIETYSGDIPIDAQVTYSHSEGYFGEVESVSDEYDNDLMVGMPENEFNRIHDIANEHFKNLDPHDKRDAWIDEQIKIRKCQ